VFKWRIFLIALLTAVLKAVSAAAAESADYFPPPESQGGWRRMEEPAEIRRLAGMDPEKLAALKQWLLDSDKRDFAAVVIRHGYIALEVERRNSARTDSGRVASVSKAICATVLAIASEQSQIFSHGWELPARHSGESGRSGEGIPADAREKPGSGGQLIAFVPSLDLVVTRQTGSSGEWQFEECLRRVCAACGH